MWIGKRGAQDHLNDYWNALDRFAPPAELARLRALIDPELTATIDTTRARYRRLRPDPAFGDRLEGELMNAFATMAGGTVPLAPVRPQTSNGKHEPWTPSHWMPDGLDRRANRRGAMAQLGLVALLLLTLIGGYFVYSSRFDHPAIVQQGTPVSTPTADWTNTRGDAGRTGLGESGPVGLPVTIWTYQTTGNCNASPAVVGQTVYVTCGTGVLTALDRATGALRWEFTAKAPLGAPAVHDGIVLAIDADGRLYGIDAQTGEQRWLDEGQYGGAPVASEGLVVVDAPAGSIAAIDVATGDVRWLAQIDPTGDARNPAIGDGIVFAGSSTNGFSALELQTGALIWNVPTGGRLTGTAEVANDVAYIGNAPDDAQGFLLALDAKTGEQRWESGLSIYGLAVQEETGFAGSVSGQVTAIDLTDGSEQWQVTVGGVARPPVVAGDVIYVNSDGDQAIYAFSTRDGSQLWKYPVDGRLSDSPGLKDGVLYTASGNGVVYAIGGADAIPAPGLASATPAASPQSVADAGIQANLVWETSGIPTDPLITPTGVAVSPNGAIYVVNGGHDTIEVFGPDGEHLQTIGSTGTGPGQFRFHGLGAGLLGDVDLDANGNIYVFDTYNARVQKLAPDGTFIATWGSHGSGPGQMDEPIGTVDRAAKRVYVTDLGGRVQIFDLDGKLLGSFGTFGSGPGQLNVPGKVVIDHDGNIWVAENGNTRVQKFDPEGNYLLTLPSSFRSLNFLGLAQDGSIMVPDYTLGTIQFFDTGGTLLGTLSQPIGGEQLRTLNGIAAGPERALYVVEEESGRLLKFQLLPPFGPEAPGEFATPRATPFA